MLLDGEISFVRPQIEARNGVQKCIYILGSVPAKKTVPILISASVENEAFCHLLAADKSRPKASEKINGKPSYSA